VFVVVFVVVVMAKSTAGLIRPLESDATIHGAAMPWDPRIETMYLVGLVVTCRDKPPTTDRGLPTTGTKSQSNRPRSSI
jgi:hypothetical protein